jgi:hypothetical protein
MSTATELLRRALEALHFDLSAKESAKVAEDIRAFLDAEPADEPVAWRIMPPPKLKITDGSWLFYDDRDVVKNLHNIGWKVEPLYTRPEPAIRKPMTEEEINRELPFECSGIYFDGFRSGIDFAEKHHGIGSDGLTLQDKCRGDKL